MVYATKQDIIDRYNEETLLLVFTRRMIDPDAAADAIAAALDAAIARALADASAELDSYLAGRYDLPLAITPPALVGYCVDIALYRGTDSVAVPEERRTRYEDAIRWAVKVGEGKIKLPIPVPVGAAPATSGASFHAPPRVFSRGND